MIEFGKTLRTAREAKGFTTSQIAERTHMLVQVVEGLENENFSRIVAPIYGRGFVKLYCEVVGLDPKPLVEEFMEIYSGNRETAIRERATPPPEPTPAPEPAPLPKPQDLPKPEPLPKPAPAPQPSLFEEPAPEPPRPEPVATRPPIPEPHKTFTAPAAPVPPPPKPQPATRETELDFGTSSGPSRYSAPMPIDDEPRSFRLPDINWRLVILASGALLVLALLFFGIRALYRATMTPPVDETAAPETVTEQAEPPAPTPAAESPTPANGSVRAPREPLPLKPFYLD